MYLVDRIKELIKVKGLQVETCFVCAGRIDQVAPAELEDAIRGLEGVDDVAVIGERHFK